MVTDQLIVTKGWFNETLPISKIDEISFLRLDGDLFASTLDGLTHLYHKVVPGDYIYVDDFASFPGCRRAVEIFREEHKIYEPLHYISESEGGIGRGGGIFFEVVWWRKRSDSPEVETSSSSDISKFRDRKMKRKEKMKMRKKDRERNQM